MTTEEPRIPLSRDRIVRTALRIVDEQGLPALSMRRLASELGVVPMAIYYHVPNKDALYDAIVEAVMSEIDLSLDRSDATFEDRLKGAAREYRRVLLSHPNALSVISDRPPRTQASLDPVEVMLRILVDGGFTPSRALAAVNVVAALVQGATWLQTHGSTEPVHPQDFPEVPPERFPSLAQAAAQPCPPMPPDEEFEFGLDALVRGLAASRG